MTDSEQLAQTARAAGLRLSTADLKVLLPAWKRYLALVEGLREATAPDGFDEG